MNGSQRLERTRSWMRLISGLGFLAIPVAVLPWAGTPGFMGPKAWWEPYVPLVGIVGVVIGNVLLFRFARATPEPDEATWRYRDL